jgi:hypothetical protein
MKIEQDERRLIGGLVGMLKGDAQLVADSDDFAEDNNESETN